MRTLLLLCLTGCALSDLDLDGDGYAEIDGDCDDLVATVHPAATEIAGDGRDQDCDGVDVLLRASGAAHVCELTDDGVVRCEGDSTFGQAEPPRLDRPVADLAAGTFHTCARLEVGDIVCWGLDRFGQASPPPGPFVGLGAYDHISWGQRDDGSWVCWGACLGGF